MYSNASFNDIYYTIAFYLMHLRSTKSSSVEVVRRRSWQCWK